MQNDPESPDPGILLSILPFSNFGLQNFSFTSLFLPLPIRPSSSATNGLINGLHTKSISWRFVSKWMGNGFRLHFPCSTLLEWATGIINAFNYI